MESVLTVENNARKNPGLAVAATALSVASAMVALGWTTGLRHVMRAALLAASVIAFFPFVAIAVCCAALLVAGLVLSIAAASAGEVGLDGFGSHGVAAAAQNGTGWLSRSVRRYYQFLRARRHPAWLGAAAGIAIGTLACWGLLAWFVIPVETRTMESLVKAQVQLEAEQKSAGRYPSPDANGHLVLGTETVTDSFGRPVMYQLQGRWKAQSYRLRSLGANGREGGDDLCVSGRSKLAAMAARFAEPLAVLELLSGSSAKWSSKLETLRSADCQSQAH
jgi:hypothetical protein